jgi:DNA-binding NarL/FixJ family response regulator
MKVAIADSNELVSRGLHALCMEMPEVDDVEIFTKYAALASSTFQADVILMDFSTDGFGLDCLPRLIKKNGNAKVVAITPLQSANTVLNAIKSGVHGYVKTDCSIKEIKDSLIEVSQGGRFFCGDIIRALQVSGVNVEELSLEDLSCEPILLSERENEILRYIATGHTNAEIADILFLSGHTVTTHRKNIMSKIGAKNTAEAVLYAVKEGVIDTDSLSFSKN